ncbi:Imm27 family immunity protein [Roseibium suaedae]|uniref:Immunity protein 27 n=1 Tax=Roseibium suaedae TaxID=735517 RepID=A0A1M7P7X6_9HYPH|nr:Imm27 family immunity protein [Roseibium suaedae]SHN12734.1 Immunity protein 27 [Roseibium suaedae]
MSAFEEDEYVGADALSRRTKLTEIRVDPEKWETLYQDMETGDLWVLDYPNSHLHGGGSPRLRRKF